VVLELVAFDIETTGFSVDDAVTVVGFALPMGVRLFVQTRGRETSGIDSFEESKEAVTAFETGRFADVVVHNAADVLRTQALGRLAESYCSKSDFDVKSLTPTIPDT